ncbi:HAMP domain-containing sensor histidine kinase [Lacibacter sp. H375]|uniref:sensor histidine kinase n=1 Tax=Lacibacter sp. H375 TaxID=3133424 RepID=UPI0030BE9E80
MFKRYEWRLLIRLILLFAILFAAAWLLVKEYFLYAGFLLPILGYQFYDLYQLLNKAQNEVKEFAESIHYRDFSRHFNVKHAPAELQPLREGFNEINSTFKVISREKETQYVYLQKILELVDTGIISYKTDTGEIVWMNESFKRMMGIPYLKTIHSLEKRDEGLYKEAINIKTGESKLATATNDKTSFKVLLSATAFQTDDQTFKLIAFQNVNEALDENEAEAWRKLLSVMTHEIMNSVAPISSLAETLKNRLHQSVEHLQNKEGSVDDLALGIETIQRRSEGLLKFAETYRNLNKITTLNSKKILVRDLFENLNQLMQPTLEQKQIELDIILKDPAVTLVADINLLEQVLINLLVNAIEAVKDKPDPQIILTASTTTAGKTVIKVSDNGSGMSAEILDKIFIPFFSTRKNGSGIGLSLCKQIMLLHKGNIRVQSKEGEGSSFILVF